MHAEHFDLEHWTAEGLLLFTSSPWTKTLSPTLLTLPHYLHLRNSRIGMELSGRVSMRPWVDPQHNSPLLKRKGVCKMLLSGLASCLGVLRPDTQHNFSALPNRLLACQAPTSVPPPCAGWHWVPDPLGVHRLLGSGPPAAEPAVPESCAAQPAAAAPAAAAPSSAAGFCVGRGKREAGRSQGDQEP